MISSRFSPKIFEGWGEKKSIMDWWKDERNLHKIRYYALRSRLVDRKITVEEALGLPNQRDFSVRAKR